MKSESAIALYTLSFAIMSRTCDDSVRMKHIQTIEALIETLIKSENIHALIVQSPPGWSKSTTIDSTLRKLGLSFIAVGSYTTPLHFYRTLAENPTSIIVLDDCSGLFSDPKTMSILKAATWQSAGSGTQSLRRVTWGSTSDKVSIPAFDFGGKVVLLTNTLPRGKETEAFLSRCLSYEINFSNTEIHQMILLAAESQIHFDNLELSRDVARFLLSSNLAIDSKKINLRTLSMGYELAKTQPTIWKELLPLLLPKQHTSGGTNEIDPTLSAKEQFANFQSRTGLSRRSFYHHKKRMGLSRSYTSKAQKV